MLEKINSPQDLKSLTLEELNILCSEIRDLIIKVVAQKGGHLASSLGAVELCVSLHYCLDTPSDTIIFDVGHQAYAHKIITGRKNDFYKLREYEGLSGFPNPSESMYDMFISGHASTAVSWAAGIAEAKKIYKEKTRTVAVIGDGSLTGGMCFEALNHCGHIQSDIMVILNHNEMSISASVGALSNYLTKIISLPIYNKIKKELENFILRVPSIGKKFSHYTHRLEESIKNLLVPGVFFEELGFRYFGPVDGHRLDVLIPTIKNVSNLEGPRILHIITKKGKGYKFAESNSEHFHSATPFNITTGEQKKRVSSFSDVLGRKLMELMEKDGRIVAITAAMSQGTGLSILREKEPDKLFDVGIAEEHAVGLAAGLTRKGLKPVVAIYSTFLQRAFDQIIHDVALQNLGVVFCIDRAGIVGEDGPTHHGVFDLGYLRMIPNLICMAPKDKNEFESMLEFALAQDRPVSIRYPKGEAYELGLRCEKITLGKAEVIYQGDEIVFLGIGSMVKICIEAAQDLKDEGINVGVINARFIKPLDERLLFEVSTQYKIMITAEENNLTCGFGSAVLEWLEKHNLMEKIRLIRLGLPDEFIPAGGRDYLLGKYGLDKYGLISVVKRCLVKMGRDDVKSKL